MVQDSRKLPPQPQLKVSPQRKEQTGIEEENWANITDPRKRRQIQNRLSQRNYRSSLKKRVEDLERLVAASDSQPLSPSSNHESDVSTKSLFAAGNFADVESNHNNELDGRGSLSPLLSRQHSETHGDLLQHSSKSLTTGMSPGYAPVSHYQPSNYGPGSRLTYFPDLGEPEKGMHGFGNLKEIDHFSLLETYPLSPNETAPEVFTQVDAPLIARPIQDQVARGGKSTLHAAVERGNLKIITLVIESGVSVNCRDESCQTALHLAAQINWPGVIELLLEKGAVTDCRDGQGMTPLHVAAQLDNEAAINSLLARDMSVINFTDTNGKTPLYYAIENSSERAVQLLLEKGADVHVQATARHVPRSGAMD